VESKLQEELENELQIEKQGIGRLREREGVDYTWNAGEQEVRFW
jgi:hypothetical protein